MGEHWVLGAEHPPHQLTRQRNRHRRGVLGDLRQRAGRAEQLLWRSTLRTSPPSSASWAENTRPVATHSIARLMPTTRGRNQLEQASGMIPRRANTKPIRPAARSPNRLK